jgi:hypothetical protein
MQNINDPVVETVLRFLEFINQHNADKLAEYPGRVHLYYRGLANCKQRDAPDFLCSVVFCDGRRESLPSGSVCAQILHGAVGFPAQIFFELRELIHRTGARGLFEPGGCRARRLGANIRARTLE